MSVPGERFGEELILLAERVGQAADPNSVPQPAGVVAIANTSAIGNASGQNAPEPVLSNNIIRGNRSFYWDEALHDLAPNPDDPEWDLAVVQAGEDEYLNPEYCLLGSFTDSSGADYDDGTNTIGDPLFVSPYNNDLTAVPIPEEGGNAVSLRFGPIGIRGDYHITCGSAAINVGDFYPLGDHSELNRDYDAQKRPGGILPDAGADEIIPDCSATIDTL